MRFQFKTSDSLYYEHKGHLHGQELPATYNLNVPLCMCHNGDQVGMLSVLPLLYSLHRHPVTGRPVCSMWILYLHLHINNHIIT
jgi:hypothetical protein